MTKKRLIAHTVVCNEECWIWYSLKSALPFVDEILVWDTGSKDATASIIKTISSPKIKFQEVPATPNETALSQTRQKMLEKTRGKWLMILDGDEVWPENSLKKVLAFIDTKGDNYDSIVVPTLNCVGDIYHISPPDSGRYKIAGRVGHFNIRFINLNRVKGLHVANPPGKLQSYYDFRDIKIQDRSQRHIAFLDAPYMHMTHLTRSKSRKNEISVFWRAAKKRFDLGVLMPKGFAYPRVFDHPPPEGVPSPWSSRSAVYYFRSKIIEPLRQVKHFLI